MDHRVGHLEGEFVSAVENYVESSAPGSRAAHLKDLKRLVSMRDSIAHAGGYRVIGAWLDEKGYYPNTFCFYLYTFGS